MTQSVIPPSTALAPGTALSLHGMDPDSRLPVTWHVTSLSPDGAPGTFLIERAVGDIRSPALWMQAQRDAQTVGAAEVIALVQRVLIEE